MKTERSFPSPTLQGLAWALAFAVLDAAQAVVFGNWLQFMDSFQVGFLVFALTTMASLVWAARFRPEQLRLALLHWRKLAGLNLAFALGWALFLLSIQLLEPAIAFSLFTGVIPLTTILAAVLGFADGMAARNSIERTGNLVLLAGLVFLCWITLGGSSGFVRGALPAAMAGLALAIAAGMAITVMLFFSRRLDADGVEPATQFATRFGIYLILSFTGWQLGFDAKAHTTSLPMLAMAVAAGIVLMAMPVYAVQKAVALVPTLTIAAFAATSPFLVFVFQQIEGRIDYAPLTLAGLSICFAGSLIALTGTWMAQRRSG